MADVMWLKHYFLSQPLRVMHALCRVVVWNVQKQLSLCLLVIKTH